MITSIIATLSAACSGNRDACVERNEVPDLGIGEAVLNGMTEGNGALHFAFTFSADGADTDGVADIALAGDSRGGFLSSGETFAAVVAQSDIGGTLQLSDPDADVTGPVDVTKLVFLSGPVVGNLDSPNVQFAPVLDAVDGPCAAGAFDGGDFSGAIFRADEGDVAVAAGEAATITKGGVAFVAGVPFAFFRSGSGSYSGLAYLWRVGDL